MYTPPTENTPEGTDFSCGVFVLSIASLLAVALAWVLAATLLSIQTVEIGMVLLSAPWFTFLYFLCRKMHRTKIIIVD